jgi:AcrR family transcriptional regulator
MKNNERKEVITQVAQLIFSKYGFLKTTIGDIAKAARMGKASLYHYFDSKEEIYKEVVEQEHKFLKEKIGDAINKENDPRKKLRIYFLKKMENLKNLANIHSALKDDYLDHYAFVEKIRIKNNKEEQLRIKEILQEGENKGIFQIDDIELTAFAIITALKGLEFAWTIDVPLHKIEVNINKLMEILFNGIVKR